jgi:hypothetical protein
MLPSQAWFPTSIVERAAWFKNFAANVEVLGPSLGFSPAEIEQVVADNEVVQFLAAAIYQNNAYTRALQSVQRTLTQGDIGDNTPELPTPPVFSPPPMVPTGIFERLIKTVNRVRVAPAFNAATGAVLGVNPTKTMRTVTRDHVPKIVVDPAFGGYRFTVKVAKLRMDAFEVQVRRNSSDRFEHAATGISSPFEVALTPLNPGQPEQIYVRVRMLKGNEPVGNFSNMVQVTVNP